VIEKRNHIGGNAYSYIDEATGIEVHKYGSHLFHTSNEAIWKYINQFSRFNNYRHFVIAKTGGEEFEMPINLSTVNSIFGEAMSPSMARAKIKEVVSKSPTKESFNLEDFAISQVGTEIYERLIKGYTTKQWGKPPSDLPREIFQRLPIRYNYNRDYFSDTYMGLPLDGYHKIFERMVESNNIKVILDNDYFQIKNLIPESKKIIYSGPVDRLMDYKFGALEWRTLDFEFENLEISDYQGCAVVNYPDLDVPFTRIHEFKHLHPERESKNLTSIAREFSRLALVEDEPYYPINTARNADIYAKYRNEIKKHKNLLVGGRLGSYKYLDMHMAIGMAFKDFELIKTGDLG
jgi:UDP-galactopyranose mutase